MHTNAYHFVASIVGQTIFPMGLVVEIGGRNINGTIRDLFQEREYISIDIADGPGVDVVANGATYKPPEKAAVVVCCEVLEHSSVAADICRNAYQMLKPGGVFIVTTATEGRAPHSAVDGGAIRPGEYYANITEGELRGWLKPFRRVQVAFNHDTHDIYAAAWKAQR